jgi:hypothetical protein
MAIGHEDFNQKYSAAVRNAKKELFDQVTRKLPLLDLVRENLKSETGPAIQLPILGDELSSTAQSDSSGTFSLSVSDDLIGTGVYDWTSPIITPFRVAWMDLQQVNSDQKLVDLIETYSRAQAYSHGKHLVSKLYAASTASGDPTSLFDIFSDTETLAGIDPANAGYWKANVIESDSADETIVEGLRRLVDAQEEAANERPDVIWCGKDVFAEYRAHFDEAKRYNEVGGKTGDTEFATLEFDGIEVRRDFQCPANEVLAACRDRLYMFSLNDNFMSVNPNGAPTPVYTVVDGTAKGTYDTVYTMASVFQAGTTERRCLSRLTRVTS